MVKIAFDLGGVIIDKQNRAITDDVMQSVKLIIEKFGNSNVFIISKAKDKWITSNNEVLENSDFYKKTNFAKENLRYCPEYADKSKICLELDIDYMIDDEIKVVRFINQDCNKTIPILFIPKLRSKDDLIRIGIDKNVIQITKWKTIRKFFSNVQR